VDADRSLTVGPATWTEGFDQAGNVGSSSIFSVVLHKLVGIVGLCARCRRGLDFSDFTVKSWGCG
jgi:hypothetical protein